MISSCKAVFFDAGGTLLHPFPSVGKIYQEVAGRHGGEADAATLERKFREVWRVRDGLSSLESHSSEKIEREWWHRLVAEVFTDVRGIRDFESFFDELYDFFARPSSWRLYPDVPEVLEGLGRQGKILGIISNWDSRLFGLLRGLGLEKYFRLVLASAVFGASKPSPRIFEGALLQAGVRAEEAVHVGDSVEDDIRGAERVGMRAVLIDRLAADRDSLHWGVRRIRSLRELLS